MSQVSISVTVQLHITTGACDKCAKCQFVSLYKEPVNECHSVSMTGLFDRVVYCGTLPNYY